MAATTIRTLYDRANRPYATIDPLGHTTTQNYDARDRLRSVVTEDPDGLGSTNIRQAARTTYTYDLADRLTNLTDPVGNVTAYGYDVLDRTTIVTDPLGKSTTYSYNLADEMTSQTDRLGRKIDYGYDILGRMTTETWVGTGARTITYGYDLANRVTTIADPDATLSSGYDALDRMTTATTTGIGSGQPTVTLTSAYDQVGNRTRLTDSLSGSGTSGQGVTTYSYDPSNRLTTITRSYGGAAGPQVTFAYDNADRITGLTRKLGTTGTAVKSSYVYDNLDRLTTLTHLKNTTALTTYAYGYDAADRLTTESSSFGGLTKAITYAYDASNQLTAADRDGAATSADESYDYDDNGNRLTGYTTTTGNRIGSSPGFTYAYDDEGNLQSKTETATGRVTTYAYDHRNRLTGATTKNGSTITAQATFTYDAADRRIRTQLDADGTGGNAPVTTWTVYDGANPYADFGGGGALQTRYLHGPAVDWLLARTAAGGATAWYLTDRLGSVRDIASTAGTVIDHIDYDAYGRVTSESNVANGDRFKFTGRELDDVTKLQYHRGRYYDAAIGRWTQEDPIGFGGGDPNLHRYVGNSPTNSTDPFGLQAGGGDVLTPNTDGRWEAAYEAYYGVNGTNEQRNQNMQKEYMRLERLSQMRALQAEGRRLAGEVVNAGEPGFVGGMMPVYGEARQAAADIERGRYYWATFHYTLAVVDALGIVTLAKAGLKGLARNGQKAACEVGDAARAAGAAGRQLSDADAIAKATEESYGFANRLRRAGDNPAASTAIVDARTGKIYHGISGTPTPITIHPHLQGKLDDLARMAKNLGLKRNHLEFWKNAANCAEFQALNRALLSGSEIGDLFIHTLRPGLETLFGPRGLFRCKNCQIFTDIARWITP